MKQIYLKLFAVAFAALTCINALADGLSLTANGTSSYLLPSNFTVDGTTVTSSDNPFTGGALVKGKYVNAFTVHSGTEQGVAAFAEPYTLQPGEEVVIYFVAYQGWGNGGSTSTIAITNSADKEIFSYTYTSGSCKVTSVKIGGTEKCTTPFSGQSYLNGKQSANGFTAGRQPYLTGQDNNTVVKVTIKKTGYVSVNFNCVNSKVNKPFENTLDAAVTADISKITFTSPISDSDRAVGITDLNLTSTVKAVQPVKYTIKYQDENGTFIKSEKRDTYVGERYTASASDMESFLSGDGLKKYVYKSGNETKTAVETAENNVITLVYTTYEKQDYTIVAKAGGEVIGTVKDGQTFLDGSDKVYVSKYMKGTDGTWYKTTEPSYGVVIDNAKIELNYEKADIDYFFEVENLSNIIGTTAGEYSGGAYCAVNGRYTASLGTLPAGKYQATAYLVGNGNRGILYQTDKEVYTTPGLDRSSPKGEYSTDFTLTNSAEVSLHGYLHNDNTTNQSADIDYIYIKKVGEVVNLPNEYNTYCAANDLDFNNNTAVAAYTAQMNDDKTAVMLKQVDKVPAGEGVILKKLGEDATAVVNLTTDVAPLADNQMKGVKADMNAEALVADNAYILVNQNFQKVGAAATGVLPAGKAYLSLPALKVASVLKMYIVGEPTGVTDVEEAVLPTDNIIYNVQGMRVKKPVKGGLYIVNGKTYAY